MMNTGTVLKYLVYFCILSEEIELFWANSCRTKSNIFEL